MRFRDGKPELEQGEATAFRKTLAALRVMNAVNGGAFAKTTESLDAIAKACNGKGKKKAKGSQL